MGRGSRCLIMAHVMRVNGCLIKSTDKVFMNGLMEENTKEHGRITSCTEKESTPAVTGGPSTGTISMTRGTFMGSITGQTGTNSRASGSMESRTGMGCSKSPIRRVGLV